MGEILELMAIRGRSNLRSMLHGSKCGWEGGCLGRYEIKHDRDEDDEKDGG